MAALAYLKNVVLFGDVQAKLLVFEHVSTLVMFLHEIISLNVILNILRVLNVEGDVRVL